MKNIYLSKWLLIIGLLIVGFFVMSSILFNINPFLYIKNVIFGYGGFLNPDKTPPEIIDKKVEILGSREVKITWTTNEPSISWIVYGPTPAYGLEMETMDYRTSHSLVLSNLSPATLYHLQILTEDKKGNRGFGGDQIIKLNKEN